MKVSLINTDTNNITTYTNTPTVIYTPTVTTNNTPTQTTPKIVGEGVFVKYNGVEQHLTSTFNIFSGDKIEVYSFLFTEDFVRLNIKNVTSIIATIYNWGSISKTGIINITNSIDQPIKLTIPFGGGTYPYVYIIPKNISTPTNTITFTNTITNTFTNTLVGTHTNNITYTNSVTHTNSITHTNNITYTNSVTHMNNITETNTITPTPTYTPSHTPIWTPTPNYTPTITSTQTQVSEQGYLMKLNNKNISINKSIIVKTGDILEVFVYNLSDPTNLTNISYLINNKWYKFGTISQHNVITITHAMKYKLSIPYGSGAYPTITLHCVIPSTSTNTYINTPENTHTITYIPSYTPTTTSIFTPTSTIITPTPTPTVTYPVTPTPSNISTYDIQVTVEKSKESLFEKFLDILKSLFTISSKKR